MKKVIIIGAIGIGGYLLYQHIEKKKREKTFAQAASMANNAADRRKFLRIGGATLEEAVDYIEKAKQAEENKTEVEED